MAVRRILSLIGAKYSQSLLSRELSRKFHPSPSSFSRNYERYTRGFQSLTDASIPSAQSPADASNQSAQNPTVNGSCSLESDQSPSNYHYTPTDIERQVIDNLKISEKNDLSMVFTCKVCNARNLKTACRESYEKGVVVSKCDSCDRFHLIVDRLGWFRESASVDEILAEQGEEVDDESSFSINLTLPDGWKPVIEDVSS